MKRGIRRRSWMRHHVGDCRIILGVDIAPLSSPSTSIHHWTRASNSSKSFFPTRGDDYIVALLYIYPFSFSFSFLSEITIARFGLGLDKSRRLLCFSFPILVCIVFGFGLHVVF